MAVAERPDLDGVDPAESVATVLMAKREVLLRVYRDRLPHEDLEDCLGQAALELVARARADGLQGERHIANALEQKFVSRIIDRQRAIGRQARQRATAAGEADAMALTDESRKFDIVVPHSEPSRAAFARDELERLREVAAELTDDQRLVLACQVAMGMDSTEFCDRFGWSPEKFRKVAQRARARLRTLLTEYELGERCRRLEGDVLAYAADAASAAQTAVVREHLGNCMGCAAMVRDLRFASNRVGALLPVPVLAKAGLGIKLGLSAKIGALWRAVTEPLARVGQAVGSGGADNAGGLAKAGVATLCAASLAGGGHWAAPKLAHHDRTTPAARAAATPTGAAAAQRASATAEPVARPALVLTGRRSAAARTTQPKTVRSHRRPAQRRAHPMTLPAAPPAPAPVRPPATAPDAPAPRPPGPTQRVSSSEFGVE
jgi:RNA polymerase sigma factor (sigma-70 family)